MDLGPPGMAHGKPPAGYGKTVPGKPEQAPRAVVHEGETVLAEPTGEGEEGTRLRPGRRRGVRGGNQPSGGEPTEEAATGGITTEDERLATEPSDVAPLSKLVTTSVTNRYQRRKEFKGKKRSDFGGYF